MRIEYFKLSPEIFSGFRAAKQALEKSSLGLPLIELIYMRISQINGCAFCLEMHGKALRKRGEQDAKIDSLAGFRVSNIYSEKEHLALEWTEALTQITSRKDSDELFSRLKQHFNEQEISDLTMAIALMNGLNRIAISMRQ